MRFCLVFILFYLTALPSFAERIELKVQELSTVRVGDPVRFGAIAIGEVKDLDLAQKLYEIELFPALKAEEIKEYDSSELALTLRKHLSFTELQRIAVKIPDHFRIRAQKNYIYPSDVKNQISVEAQKFCSGCEVQFDDLRLPTVKGTEEILSVKIDTSSIHAAGSFIVSLQIENSRGRDQYWVTGKFSTYKKALVAKRLLKQGERITSEDVEERRTNITQVRDGIPGLEEIQGKALTKSIQIGQALFFSDLKKELALKRGEPVKIVIATETIEIMSQGIAEESGAIGDTVKVKNTEQKLFSGKITEPGTVRIQ